MFDFVRPEYFLLTEHVVKNGMEPKVKETKPTLHINPHIFAQILATAPPDVLTLADITPALEKFEGFEKQSKTVDCMRYKMNEYYSVSLLSDGPYTTIILKDMDECMDTTTSETTTMHWFLKGVIPMKNKYYFLTYDLEEWLTDPVDPNRMKLLYAIHA
jgi:hypothetical protein